MSNLAVYKRGDLQDAELEVELVTTNQVKTIIRKSSPDLSLTQIKIIVEEKEMQEKLRIGEKEKEEREREREREAA